MGVYRVLQRMHLDEPVEEIRDVIEDCVNLIERDEERLSVVRDLEEER